MKRLCVALVLAAALFMVSCGGLNDQLTSEEVAEVMAIAGSQMGGSSGLASMVSPAGTDSRATFTSTMNITGPEGGSAVFSYSFSEDLSRMVGSITFSDFAIEYEDALYTLSGTYDLTYTYDYDIAESGFIYTLTHVSEGSIGIAKDNGAAYTYVIDTTSNTSMTMTTTDTGVMTVTMDVTVTGTIDGEDVSSTETITYTYSS